MSQNPFHDSIQDGSALLEAISAQLECFSDLTDLPLNPAERGIALQAARAINVVLSGVLAVVITENTRWGLRSHV